MVDPRGPDVVEVGDGVWLPGQVLATLNADPAFHQYRKKIRGRNHRLDVALQQLVLAGLRHQQRAGSGPGRSLPPAATPASRLITTTEAATRLGITDRAVRRAITEGRLPAERPGFGFLVAEDDVEQFAARRSA